MTPEAPIAVTGATGFVGQAVLAEAVKRGQVVRALTRREQPARENIEWVCGDLGDHAALRRLVEGSRGVLHIAGVVNASDEAGFMTGNVAGTQNIVAAAQAGSVKRFLAISSLAAREPGISTYGRSKRLAEEVVQVSGLDWTILRPPAIYGPRDTEMFELFRAARRGVVPLPTRGRLSLLHVDDLARLMLDALPGGEAVSGRILEPDDGRPGGWSHHELAQAIGRSVGKRVWTPVLPSWLLHAAARTDRLLRGRKAKLTPDRSRYMVHPDWVASEERPVPAALWEPAVEGSQGLAETARWYREQGWF
jgi:UDP-glucose 4-epimerase